MATNTKEIYLTESGYEEIKKELDELKLVKRPEVIQALKEARALGDLSENAEYDAARQDQAQVEGKIAELEMMLEKAIIVKNVSKDSIGIGSKVKIQYVEDEEEEEYTIVGSKEVDLFAGKISNESPIAQAILNHKVNDVVDVNSPAGSYQVKIIEIC
ncbi:MAG: transcription elongation factor GreA [Firmicutes bacterium]|nr:transcription elongation factor GreA [Bacillota bacterium]